MNNTEDDLKTIAGLFGSDHSSGCVGDLLLLLKYRDDASPSRSEAELVTRHLLITHRQHLEPGAPTRRAAMAGLDMRRFSTAMAKRTSGPRWQAHRRSGEQIDLHKSPSFFLNAKGVDVSCRLDHPQPAVQTTLGMV